MSIEIESEELHRKGPGKLNVVSSVTVNDKHDLSLAYTPGVGHVCKLIAEDKNRVREFTIKQNTIAVVTDGSAVLGLGNIGPEAAIPVMEGKAVLFKEFAGLNAFPICLATQDTEEIIRTVKLLEPIFGGVNLEDISAPRCFEIEKRLKEELSIPVMHDDQHGTAVVVLAALTNAITLRAGFDKSERIVISGSGAAGTAIAELLTLDGFSNLVLLDSVGVIGKHRTDLNSEKQKISMSYNPEAVSGGLADALVGASVFIGVSKAGVLKKEMIRTMHEKPIIFALANPTPEIFPDEALEAGAFVVATGRSDFANQINNVLAFPGIFRGALDNHVTQITKEMLLKAAKAIASAVPSPTVDKIIPGAFEKEVVGLVADSIK